MTATQTANIGPQIQSLPYSTFSTLSEWVEAIASELWVNQSQVPALAESLRVSCPGCLPRNWDTPGGWSIYSPSFEQWFPIAIEDLPTIMVLDVESQQESVMGHWRPILAVAMSCDGWYCWRWDGVGLPETIPFPGGRVIVGHNVRAYDSRYLICEYDLNAAPTHYIDTKELGQMIMGIDSSQFNLYKQCQGQARSNKGYPDWYNHALTGSLKEMSYRVLGKTIDKSVRSSLERWDMAGMIEHLRGKLPLEVQQKLEGQQLTYGELTKQAAQILQTFQDLAPTSLAEYCCADVVTTYELFQWCWTKVSHHWMKSPISWWGMHEVSQIKAFVPKVDEAIAWEKNVVNAALFDIDTWISNVVFDATQETHPGLIWEKLKSGPNKGTPKWKAELEKAEHRYKSRAAVPLLKLQWDGENIEWKDRKWMAGMKFIPLPSDPGKPLVAHVLRRSCIGYVEEGRLTSEVWGRDELLDVFRLIALAEHPLNDYSGLYSVRTPVGPLTLGGTSPSGGLSHFPRLSVDLSPAMDSIPETTMVKAFLHPWGQIADLDFLLAHMIASTFRGCDSDIIQDVALLEELKGRSCSEEYKQVVSSAHHFADRGISPILGWKCSEAIHKEHTRTQSASVRYQWAIDSMKTDLAHIFLLVLRAFQIEYDLTIQMCSMESSLMFHWIVLNNDIDVCERCIQMAWGIAWKVALEQIAERINSTKDEVHQFDVSAMDLECPTMRVVYG